MPAPMLVGQIHVHGEVRCCCCCCYLTSATTMEGITNTTYLSTYLIPCRVGALFPSFVKP